MLLRMPRLRLVTDAEPPSRRTSPVATDGELPRVSLRLLMAASGRCSCDDCLIAYRRGDRSAGIVRVGERVSRLTAVR
jgi:hypothetical protein